MKKITILIVMAFYCLYFPAFGQTTITPKYLHVGDKMPDLIITNVLNAKQKTIDLKKLRGKVILLDFWNSYCSSCIDGFNELDSLQRIYPNKLQVILVNSTRGENQRAVDIVINRTKAWFPNGFNLPIIYPDAVIRPNFIFRSVPHTVWIGQDGTIIAITDKAAITTDNIASAVAGRKLNLKEKTD